MRGAYIDKFYSEDVSNLSEITPCEQAYLDFIHNDLQNIQYDEFVSPEDFSGTIVKLTHDNFRYGYIFHMNNDIYPELVCIYEYGSMNGDACAYVIFRYQNGKVIMANTIFDGDIAIVNNRDVYIRESIWRDIGGFVWIYNTYENYNIREKYYVSVIYLDSSNEDERDLQFDFSKINDMHSNPVPGVRVDGIAVSKEQSNEIYTYLEKNTDIVTFNAPAFYGLKKYSLQPIDDKAYRLITDRLTPSPYEYGLIDNGVEVALPSDKLATVTDQNSAEKAVDEAAKLLTSEQKQSATGIDKMTLFAEEAIAQAAATTTSEGIINIADEVVNELEQKSIDTANAVNMMLANNGINTQREITKTVKVKTTFSGKVSINKDVNKQKVDVVKVETPFIGVSMAAGNNAMLDVESKGVNKVAITFNTNSTSMVKVSFPGVSGNSTYMAVVDENGNPVGGKYNPATDTIEAKISDSGVYSVTNNPKDFSDIKDKAQEMQDAIKVLASKGVINGTSVTEFSPNNTISRAEVAALIVRTLSKLDPNEDGGFTDVAPSNWFFGAAGSSKKYGIINGFEDNTFRGEVVIPKDQIIAVSARVLKTEMRYKTPDNISEYLPYADTGDIADWAKGDVALATMANLIVKRMDDKFVGNDEMTRGDAAIILYRLFMKIW